MPVVGSLLTYWVGHRLIARNAERYAREGESALLADAHQRALDGISLAGGEADEKRRVDHRISARSCAPRRAWCSG